MAGAGYKLFSTGDVLSASDVNTYLMQQTVMSFASSAARTTALASVLAEGMVTYLQDTNVVEIYTGASWVSLDDPNAIQNSIVDAKGDIISATADNTPARLAVGTNGQTLVADSAEATGLKWATAASGSPASGVSRVNTQESTTSASFVNLTTTQAVTLTTGTKALVSLSCQIVSNGTTEQPAMSVAITGASSVSAATATSLNTYNTAAQQAYGISILFTGLTAGSNVFTAKFADFAGTTSTFQNREISVIDLGS